MFRRIIGLFKVAYACTVHSYKAYAQHHGAMLQGIGTVLAGIAAVIALAKGTDIGEKISSLADSVDRSSRLVKANQEGIEHIQEATIQIKQAMRDLLQLRKAIFFESIRSTPSQFPNEKSSKAEVESYIRERFAPRLPEGVVFDVSSIPEIAGKFSSTKSFDERVQLLERATNLRSP